MVWLSAVLHVLTCAELTVDMLFVRVVLYQC